jgi:protein tyrosine phosphatase (PTP) superfamily phosphohydrolase (DUF442 family)
MAHIEGPMMGLIAWIKGLLEHGPKPEVVPDAERPAKWARKVDVEGAPNAFWVDDGVLMRSAQPTAQGLKNLRDKYGIKTIISLRTTTSDIDLAEPNEYRYPGINPYAMLLPHYVGLTPWLPDVPGREEDYLVEDHDVPLSKAISDANEAGLRLVHIWFHPVFPTEHQVAEFLRLACDPANQPVLVHCRHGSDRTGTMCAAYRIVAQGWPRNEAIDEMRRGGYGFHYNYFQNLLDFLGRLDLRRIRKDAGL